MAEARRRLILGNGEQYVANVQKPGFGRSPEPPRSYGEARALVQTGVSSALAQYQQLPATKRLPDEAVFCVRLHPDVTAKSYDPSALFEDVPDLKKVGSRYYKEAVSNVASTKRMERLKEENEKVAEGRLVFVQSSPAGFQRLIRELDRAESAVRKPFRDAIQRIERFDVLRSDEQIMGFDEKWKEGRVELIFHPTRIEPDRQLRFIFDLFGEIGVPVNTSHPSVYPGGPTFVSCHLTRSALTALTDTNPLRAAHPLVFAGFSDLRSAKKFPAPKPPGTATRSTIKVGVFDGGVDPTVPLLQGHVEEDTTLAIKTAPLASYIAHGTAVAGAVLYGALNGVKPTANLPTPPVSVVSIRALPVSNSKDRDLYEAIDVIENAVPKRPDIKVFNISFGPVGPILDDRISRFTYVLDTLAYKHRVTFFVAVGNDAETLGLERIQAPSDLVHGLGVGAFTLVNGEPAVAPYSCRGPGRECGKIKPDVSAFGGCENFPMHLVSTEAGQKLHGWGTSYASPFAARVGAQASEGFDRSSALLSRALLIHSAVHPNGLPDHLLGHGCVPESVDDILTCDEGSVTVVFQGDIIPTRYIQLPIPLPTSLEIPGKVQIAWTIAGLPPTDLNHPGDYTCGCIEDTFYPNSQVFTFTEPVKAKAKKVVLHLENDKKQIAKLIAGGWHKSDFPQSESGNRYKDELMRRALDCKWEPVVRREKSKFATCLYEPSLILHGIGRHGIGDRFGYVAVVTVRAPKFKGDLYAAVRTQYPALAPIRVKTEAEIRVAI
jgi:hypothetical protein